MPGSIARANAHRKENGPEEILGAALRYVLSGRSRVRYGGGRAARFEPHPFEDLALVSRVLRAQATNSATP